MIDHDIRDFIADSERFYPPGAAALPIVEQRRLYDRYAETFAVARPAGVTSQDAALRLADRAIPLRRYNAGQTRRGTILYAHGGGFMLGSLDSHDGIVARIAAATGADVVAIDYRLVPEHHAPAAFDDVLAVAEAVLDRACPWPEIGSGALVLMGDSAGGTLAAATALHIGRERPKALAGLALVYPALSYEPAEPARSDEARAPMLTLADVHLYRDLYLAGQPRAAGRFLLDAEDLDPLPPTGILAAEHDPLRDDCTVLAGRLAERGRRHLLLPGTGLVHGWLRALDRSPAAAAAFEALTRFVATVMAEVARDGDGVANHR